MNLHAITEAIKNSGTSIYIVSAGCGAGLQNIIWQEPGTSDTLAGATFLNYRRFTDKFAGFNMDDYCSPEATANLAIEAYIRAKQHAVNIAYNRPAVGLAITGSVATTQEHKGDHRFYVSMISDHDNLKQTIKVTIRKAAGEEARIKDGSLTDFFALSYLLVGICKTLDPDIVFEMGKYITNEVSDQLNIGGDDHILSIEHFNDTTETEFWKRPEFTAKGNRHFSFNDDEDNHVVFPGSFNPMHYGHTSMMKDTCNALADYKEKDTGKYYGVFLVSVNQPNKDPVSVQECLKRVAVFRNKYEADDINCRCCMLFTKDLPLFVDKFKQFPDADFIVGMDTLDRMLDPQWGPSTEEVINAMPEGKVHVFIRRSQNMVYPNVGNNWAKLFNKVHHVYNSDYDISSTQLREANKVE